MHTQLLICKAVVVSLLYKGVVLQLYCCVLELFSHAETGNICSIAARRATGLESLDWAQGPEQQAAQMFKKYIRLVCPLCCSSFARAGREKHKARESDVMLTSVMLLCFCNCSYDHDVHRLVLA